MKCDIVGCHKIAAVEVKDWEEGEGSKLIKFHYCLDHYLSLFEMPTHSNFEPVRFGGPGKCVHCGKDVSNRSYHEARCHENH